MNLPDFLDPDIWEAFLERREATQKKFPFTPKAQKLLIGRLMKYHAEGWDVNEALETAAIAGWLTVYPKVKRGAKTQAEIALEIAKEREAFAVKPNDAVRAQIAALLGRVAA